MIGLILGETELGKIIVRKLNFLKKEFVIIDISKKKIFKRNKNSYSLSIGQLGKAVSILKKNKCKEIIFAGKVVRPNLHKTKFDFKALYYLPKLFKQFKKSDSSIIKLIIKIFEKEGFKIINSMRFTQELVLKKGIYTKAKPNKINKKDIKKGKTIMNDIKEHNVGQAIIVRNNQIIGIETHDGTDSMIKRAYNLIKLLPKNNKKQGILLKHPKKNQDLRIDLPTVGAKTINMCAKVGLRGIVMKANSNIFIDKNKCINIANKNKMFISVI
jgi:UDP-2,3-diacylglucosamine hydrolase